MTHKDVFREIRVSANGTIIYKQTQQEAVLKSNLFMFAVGAATAGLIGLILK